MNNDFYGGFDAPAFRIQPIQKRKPQPAAQRKGFWTDMISTGGGAGGALAGAATGAAVGSVVPVVGTAAGGILGALIGGAAGGAGGQVLENRVSGDSLGKDVGREALINGIFGAGPIRGASLAALAGRNLATGVGRESLAKAGTEAVTAKPIRSLVFGGARTGAKLERSGSRLLGSQANLGKKDIRELGAGRTPESVISNLNQRYGVRNIDQMAEMAPTVTGESGAYSNWAKNAIGNSAGVDVGDLRKVTDDLLTDLAPNVGTETRKRITESVKNSLVKAYGGSKGSLNPKAAPLDVFDVVQSWERKAAELLNKATVTTADQEQAQVYRALADQVKDRLFTAPGVSEGLNLARGEATTALKQMAAQAPTRQMRKAYGKLVDEANGISDINQLRQAQSDWVAATKVNQGVEAGRAGAAQALGGQAQGLGKLVQRPFNMLAMPLDAATPRVGSMMSKAGGMAGGRTAKVNPLASLPEGATTEQASRAGIQGVGKGGAARTGIVGALSAAEGQAPQGMMTPEQEQAELQRIQGLSQEDLGGDSAAGQQQPSNPFGISSQQVAQGMVQAMQAGDIDSYKQLKDLYELVVESEQSGVGGGLNATTAKAAAMSANAENTLGSLEQMMQQAGGAKGLYSGFGSGVVNGLAAGLQRNNSTRTYDDLVDGSVSQIARALGETGALSDSDRRIYATLMPRLTDTPAVAQAKFAELRRRMKVAQQNTLYFGAGASADPYASDEAY